MYSWHLRHQLNNVLSKVWWFCCSFDLRMHPCHFHHYSAWWQPAVLYNSCSLAFIARTQLTDRQVKSYHRVFWEASSGTQRNGSFNKTKTNRNQMLWTNTFPCSSHHESWAAVLTSAVMISLILHWRLIHMSRETAKLYYHYHHPLNPVCFQSITWHCTIPQPSVQSVPSVKPKKLCWTVQKDWRSFFCFL